MDRGFQRHGAEVLARPLAASQHNGKASRTRICPRAEEPRGKTESQKDSGVQACSFVATQSCESQPGFEIKPTVSASFHRACHSHFCTLDGSKVKEKTSETEVLFLKEFPEFSHGAKPVERQS